MSRSCSRSIVYWSERCWLIVVARTRGRIVGSSAGIVVIVVTHIFVALWVVPVIITRCRIVITCRSTVSATNIDTTAWCVGSWAVGEAATADIVPRTAKWRRSVVADAASIHVIASHSLTTQCIVAGRAVIHTTCVIHVQPLNLIYNGLY